MGGLEGVKHYKREEREKYLVTKIRDLHLPLPSEYISSVSSSLQSAFFYVLPLKMGGVSNVFVDGLVCLSA